MSHPEIRGDSYLEPAYKNLTFNIRAFFYFCNIILSLRSTFYCLEIILTD